MKKPLLLFAAVTLCAAATSSAAIIFNPANPLSVANQGGFTGTSVSPGAPYSQALLRFTFSGLNPSPLPASFQITGISLQGPGITTSIFFPDLTITGNGAFQTSYVSINSSVPSLDFANISVSFNLPGGVINDGASFSMAARYADSTDDQRGTSSTGPIFNAQASSAIPEPGTWAAAALLVGGAALARWRKRANLS